MDKRLLPKALAATLLFALVFPIPLRPGQAAKAALSPDGLAKALEYSKGRNGLALLVLRDGKILLEDYHNGYTSESSHILTSGTKCFAGAVLAALVEDKLAASFDERAAATLGEWKADPLKSRITLRQLLDLTSGLDPGPLGRIIGYEQALALSSLRPPGDAFQYGPASYQAFGEVVKRKLKGETVIEYLTRRVFRPIGLEPTSWRFGQDRNPSLATGAEMRASDWAKYGEFVRNRGKWNDRQVVRADLIGEILKPSPANPNFGLGFWLEAVDDIESEESGRTIDRRTVPAGTAIRQKAFKIAMAAGAGKQRLYILDSLGLVVVRQGKASDFKDTEFLALLLGPAK